MQRFIMYILIYNFMYAALQILIKSNFNKFFLQG